MISYLMWLCTDCVEKVPAILSSGLVVLIIIKPCLRYVVVGGTSSSTFSFMSKTGPVRSAFSCVRYS